MLILSGFSESRSTYCKTSSYLRLYGWILTPKVSKIVLYSKNEKISEISIDINREDIWLAYNKIGRPLCGWSYESEIINLDIDTLFLHFYDENEKLFLSQKIDVVFNQEKENHLASLIILDAQKISSNPVSIYNKLKDDLQNRSHIYKLNEENYFEWFHRVNYTANYPQYCQEFGGETILHTKALQHYLSILLLDIQNSDTYIDIASSHSVCPDIIRKFHTTNIYRQDIQYKIGVHGELIGSNAENIPLLDNSIDKMALHCSFEHFENNADINFIKEAHRILKPNGKFVITPLYLSETAHILTSPSIWENKYGLQGFPKFTQNHPIIIKEDIKQRQEKIFSPESLRNEILEPYETFFKFEIYYIQEVKNKMLQNYPKFTLVGTKKV